MDYALDISRELLVNNTPKSLKDGIQKMKLQIKITFYLLIIENCNKIITYVKDRNMGIRINVILRYYYTETIISVFRGQAHTRTLVEDEALSMMPKMQEAALSNKGQ